MKTKPESTDKPSKPDAMELAGNITLSERDYARVVAAITEPAAPTPALVHAMSEYEAHCKTDPMEGR